MNLSPLAISLIALAVIILGASLGAFLSHALPRHHLSDDSKDIVRLGAALLATISALVISLLISSAKTTYDAQSNRVRQLTANIILLDNTLERYGSEAKEARKYLRQTVNALVGQTWEQRVTARSAPFVATEAAETTFQKIAELSPKNDTQTFLKTRAMQLFLDTAQARLLLFVEGKNAIPFPFLVILVFWLTIIFTSFSLFSRLNPINAAALLVFAFSAAGGIFLILELSQPFAGLMEISSTPLLNSLVPIDP